MFPTVILYKPAHWVTSPDTPTARPKPDNSHQVTFLGEPQMAQLKQDNFCYLKKKKKKKPDLLTNDHPCSDSSHARKQ